MKCPNCGHENADGAQECLNCRVIFGKLRERKEAPPPAKPAGPGPAGTYPLPKVLLALAMAAVPAWFFLKPVAKQSAASAAAETAQPTVVVTPETQRQTAEAAPAAAQNMWKFEGSVVDLLKETPVEGAALKFYGNDGGETFQAFTDGMGRYSLDLKPLETGGYGLFITHPWYGNRHWDAGDTKKSLKERCRLGQGVQFVSAEELMRHVSTPGGTAVYDFAVYPNSLEKLTEEEKAECWRGISGR